MSHPIDRASRRKLDRATKKGAYQEALSKGKLPEGHSESRQFARYQAVRQGTPIPPAEPKLATPSRRALVDKEASKGELKPEDLDVDVDDT